MDKLTNDTVEKLKKLKDMFIELLEKNKTKESDTFDKYKNMTMEELVEDFSKNASIISISPIIATGMLMTELGIDVTEELCTEITRYIVFFSEASQMI
jgi:hypothetical protein